MGLVRLFQTVAFHLFLAVGKVQAVLPRQFLADACAAYPLVAVADCPAVIGNAVEGDMHMRMFLVEMAHDEDLRVGYPHFFQVFQCYPCHCAVGQAMFVLLGECQCDVSDRLRYPRIHPCLCFEATRYCLLILGEQAVTDEDFSVLFLVKNVAYHTLEVASLDDFGDHRSIRLSSSSMRATSTRHSNLTVAKPAALALCASWLRLFAMPHSWRM